MRRLNNTTVSVGATILLAVGAGCLTVWAELDQRHWAVWACICFGATIVLFVFGWVLPRVVGGRSSGESDAPSEKSLDRDAAANSRKNVAEDDQRELEVEVPPETPVHLPKGIPPNTTLHVTSSEELEGEEREEVPDASS